MSNNKKKLVLSLDACGMKILTPLMILDDLNKKLGDKFKAKQIEYKGLSTYIDVLAGVSSSSLCVAEIAKETLKGNGSDAIKFAIDFLLDNKDKFFVKSKWGGIFGPKYDVKSLHDKITERFEKIKFGDLSQKVMLTAFNIDSCNTVYRTNIGEETDRKKLNDFVWDIDGLSLSDAVKSSVATQVYFGGYGSKYQTRDNTDTGKLKYDIDGGNSRITPVLQTVLSLHSLEDVNFSDMFVLAFSGGETDLELGFLKDCGMTQFAANALSFGDSMNVSGGKTDNALTKMLIDANRGKYHYISPKLTKAEYNASFETVPSNDTAKKYIQDNSDYFSSIVDDLFVWICEKENIEIA